MTSSVTLRLVKGRLEGAEPGLTEYVFDERTTSVLGRAEDCVPRLPNDERHRTVSRHHCLLDINPPDARIRDFGSLNGTYVNGRKIGQRAAGQTPEQGAAAASAEHDLSHGDEIRLGDTVFRVEIRGARQRTLVLTDPGAMAKRLVDLARDGDQGLAPIAGYTLIRELGRGGMGAVYLAHHQNAGSDVALKVMLPRVAASTDARARFLREVELTRALRHPNIAALYDAGYAGGTFFFTTEYCAGGSLDVLLARRGGRLDAGEAVRLACQVLEGLEHAHGRGVVHRDLTPQNILLGDTAGAPVAKVGDFGLAKAFDQAGLSGLTRTGAVAGKPVYMPRQQVINFRNVTPAVDVWALAACLYNALTGAYPRDFPPGRDPWQVILQTAPVPIRRRDPKVPKPLATIIDKALTESPRIGYQSAADLRQALLTAAP